MYKIQNVVCTTSFGCKLSAKDLLRVFPDATYRPRKFPSVTLKTPLCTFLIFETGKLVSVGSKSVTDTNRGIALLVDKLGKPISDDVQVSNMVASMTLDFRVNLEELSYFKGALYEPLLFPGLKMKVGRVTVVVFRSGKAILTGAKCEQEIAAGAREFFRIASQYKY